MAKKKVMVVVDYQKDFVDGALGFDTAPQLDAGIAALIREYVANGDYVICTQDTHESNYLNTQEGRKLPVEHCIINSNGWKFYGKTGETIRELSMDNDNIKFVVKPTFPSMELGEGLRKMDANSGIESITFVGLVTNMCVIGNAIIAKAACPEAEIIIKKDLVDSFDKELHQKALDVMASMQMTVE